MIRLGYFNKKLNLNYILKLKIQNIDYNSKQNKIGAKPTPNWHKKTMRHNNKIFLTQQSTIASFSNKQRDTKQTAATI